MSVQRQTRKKKLLGVTHILHHPFEVQRCRQEESVVLRCLQTSPQNIRFHCVPLSGRQRYRYTKSVSQIGRPDSSAGSAMSGPAEQQGKNRYRTASSSRACHVHLGIWPKRDSSGSPPAPPQYFRSTPPAFAVQVPTRSAFPLEQRYRSCTRRRQMCTV